MQESLQILKKIWYRKLEDSGFDDAENTSHPDQPLKTWHSFKFKDALKLTETSTYYLKAIQLVDTYDFDNSTHRKIWELHCEGYSKRKIEKEITECDPTYKRSQIETIINFIASSIK